VTFPETAVWGHGGVTYPLESSPRYSLLEDADPALAIALDFYVASLDLHLGQRLQVEAQLEGIKISRAVEKRLSTEPSPAMMADNFRFPLFALYRVTETHTAHTTSWDKSVSEWAFAYVLPVLTPRQIERLSPVLHAVARVIGHATRQGSEPSYLAGENVWVKANIQSARLRDVRYSDFAGVGQQPGTYRAVTGTIEVVERDMPVEGSFEPFNGANIHVDHTSGDGTQIAEVAQVETYPAPTISSVSPDSGSSAGGTSVAITGTGFRAPMRVSFGGVEGVAVVVSSTSVSAITPVHDAYTTFMADVVLTGPDGQTARSLGAFTFTTP
jgi:hypothetical protein